MSQTQGSLKNDRMDGKENDGELIKRNSEHLPLNIKRLSGDRTVVQEARRNTMNFFGVQATPISKVIRSALTSPRNLKAGEPWRSCLSHQDSPSSRVAKRNSRKSVVPRKLSLNLVEDTHESGHNESNELRHTVISSLGKSQNSSTRNLTTQICDAQYSRVAPNVPAPLKGQEIDHKEMPEEILTDRQLSIPDLAEVTGSLPVFSMSYLTSIQEQHSRSMSSLEKMIEEKNSELNQAILERQKLNHQNALLLHRLKVSDRVTQEQEIMMKSLRVQCAHLGQGMEHAENLLAKSDDLVSELRSENFEFKKRIDELSDDYIEEVKQLKELVAFSESKLSAAEARAKQEIKQVTDNLNLEKSLTLKLESKMQSHISEESSLKEQLNVLSQMFDKISEHSDHLELQLLASEADNGRLKDEFIELTSEYEKFKNDAARREEQLSENLRSHEESLNECTARLESMNSQLENYKFDIQKAEDLSAQSDFLRHKIDTLTGEILQLRASNAEKDKIISGDTKKLSQLLEKIETLERQTSQLNSDRAFRAHEDEKGTLKQIADLKRQIVNAQRETDEKIQEVAEELFHQYSKKHELKVNQLREKYELKLEERCLQIERKNRHIENLESRLETEKKEKTFLLKALEKADR